MISLQFYITNLPTWKINLNCVRGKWVKLIKFWLDKKNHVSFKNQKVHNDHFYVLAFHYFFLIRLVT